MKTTTDQIIRDESERRVNSVFEGREGEVRRKNTAYEIFHLVNYINGFRLFKIAVITTIIFHISVQFRIYQTEMEAQEFSNNIASLYRVK
jgi:hypothetical protein